MNIIDLFSGAGGLTFGFYYNLLDGRFIRSNNNFIFANEYSVQAATAFSENFPDIHMENCDIRERVFIIGIRNDLNIDFDWDFTECPYLTIKNAISDLPFLSEGQSIDHYTGPATNEYQRLMRGENQELTQHFCGIYGNKIRTVIRNVKQGQGKDDFNALIDSGVIKSEYRLTSGYRNTYGRLIADRPSTTITNNMCTPSGLIDFEPIQKNIFFDAFYIETERRLFCAFFSQRYFSRTRLLRT